MPPKGKLPDAVDRRLREVDRDGRSRPARRQVAGRRRRSTSQRAASSGRFNRRKLTPPPTVKNAAWPQNEIDRYRARRARSEEACSPSPTPIATRSLRRVTFDLTGLPPTPAEIDAFVDRSLRRKAVEKRRRSAARVAAVRRTLGPALARRRPLRRDRAARSGTCRIAWPGAIAITSSTPSTPTSRTTSSFASRSPATCCRVEVDAERDRQLIATGFLAIGPQGADRARSKSSSCSTWPTSSSTRPAAPSWPARPPAPAATITSSTRFRRPTTTP